MRIGAEWHGGVPTSNAQRLITQCPALPRFAPQWLLETHALIPGTIFV